MASPSWSERLNGAEKVYDAVHTVDAAEWLIHAASGLLGISLFIAAAHRQKQGDYLGAGLSMIGAVICAATPILAKLFES